jgi:hypothetical protein
LSFTYFLRFSLFSPITTDVIPFHSSTPYGEEMKQHTSPLTGISDIECGAGKYNHFNYYQHNNKPQQNFAVFGAKWERISSKHAHK